MPKFGATGRFPEGKLDEDDEGELRLGIAYDPYNDVVRIEFGKPIAWLALNPEDAIEFASIILKRAKARE